MSRTLPPPSTSLCILILLYGAFSRLTHGAHTPSFYAYQIARAPDDGGSAAQLIPLVDVTLAVGMCVPVSRRWATRLNVLFNSIGVLAMLGKGAGWEVRLDVGLTALAGLSAYQAS